MCACINRGPLRSNPPWRDASVETPYEPHSEQQTHSETGGAT